MRHAEIVPSLLSADFADLTGEIRKVERAGCGRLHLDVMDGRFVPNISFGPVVIRSIRKITDLYFQSHLMIEEPERYLDAFADAGVNAVTIHREACEDPGGTLERIRGLGMDAGLALRPATPLETLDGLLDRLDLVLVMTVEPGFGGQKFIAGSDEKVRRLRDMLKREGRDIPIGVDGGINADTAPAVVEAGATHLIAGNAFFKGDVEQNIKLLNNSIK
ncbi:MAG: ribulose-phosphate 3-epimerase [bacterium]